MELIKRSKPIKPDESASIEVHFNLQNINGRTSRGRPLRRDTIVQHFKIVSDKPDFLALVDRVCWKDIEAFLQVLHDRWPGSEYSHVAKLWDVSTKTYRQFDGTKAYKTNGEALIYDAALWEHLEGEDSSFELHDFPTKAEFLRNRFRAGAFRHKPSQQVIVVMVYHGPRNPSRKNPATQMNEKAREECFEGRLPTYLLADSLELFNSALGKLKSQYDHMEPPLFICGDFNFFLGKEKLRNGILKPNNSSVFPETSDRLKINGVAYNSVDYILVRGKNACVLSCREYNIGETSLPASVENTEERTTVSIKAEELMVNDIRCKEPSVPIKIASGDPDSLHQPHVLETDEVKVSQTPKTRVEERNIHGELFDHNFVYMHARISSSTSAAAPPPNVPPRVLIA